MSVLDRPELQDVVFFVPPIIGGLLGARYAQGRTVRETVISYLTAVVMGISIGAGASEYLHLGPWTAGGIMFTVASVGHEAFAYLIAALREGTKDPASTFRKWVDAFLGRRPAGEDWQQKPASVAAPLVSPAPSPLLPPDGPQTFSPDRRP